MKDNFKQYHKKNKDKTNARKREKYHAKKKEKLSSKGNDFDNKFFNSLEMTIVQYMTCK